MRPGHYNSYKPAREVFTMDKELNLMKDMKFDEVINCTLDLYRKHFVYFIKILSYFFVPALLIIILISMKFYDAYIKMIGDIASKPFPGDAFNAESVMGLIGIIFMITSVYTMFIILVNAGVIRGIDDKINGRNETEGEVVIHSLKKIIPLFITTSIAFVMMGIGMLFCVFPFFILAVYLAYVPQAVMIENRSAFGAIGRSFSVTKGYFWPTLVIPLVYFLVYSFISSVITYSMLIGPYIDLFKSILDSEGQIKPDFMMDFYGKNAYIFLAQIVLNILLYIVMTPILNIAMTLKYYNIKNLKEGTSLIDEIKQEKSTL
jgi:hypothetical protein